MWWRGKNWSKMENNSQLWEAHSMSEGVSAGWGCIKKYEGTLDPVCGNKMMASITRLAQNLLPVGPSGWGEHKSLSHFGGGGRQGQKQGSPWNHADFMQIMGAGWRWTSWRRWQWCGCGSIERQSWQRCYHQSPADDDSWARNKALQNEINSWGI